MVDTKEIIDLSNEELAVLAKENPDDIRYPHALFHKNRGVLTTVAMKLYGKYSGDRSIYNGHIYTEMDYIDGGYEVILMAIKNYNPKKDYKFITYIDRLYSNYVKRVMFRTGMNDTPRDMASHCISLNERVITAKNKSSGDDTELQDLIPAKYNLEEITLDKMFLSSTVNTMKKVCDKHKRLNKYLELNDRDFDMMYRRYVKNETLDKIGKTYSITRERVRQIIDKKVRILKKEMINDGSVCR